ncbi:MAG: FtsX-like permease family protein [Candidatus Brocadiae bacterium]|nr:FtsX-like permease family protein [Candidatus Brocadiia bacterium]
MRLADLFRIALGNLLRQKLQAVLTVMGVLVGTAAIVLMVSLGVGLQKQTIELFNEVDFLTTVRVLPQKRSKSLMTFGRPLGPATRKLDDTVIAEIRALPGVLTAYPAVNVFTRLTIERTVEGKKKPLIGGSVEYVGLPQAGIVPLYRNALVAGGFWDGETPAERCIVVPADLLAEMNLAPPLPGKEAPGETPAGRGDPRWNAVLGMEVRFQTEVTVATGKEPAEGEEEAPDPPAASDEDDGEMEKTVTKKVIRRFRIVGIYDSTDIGMPWAPAVFVPLEQGLELARMRTARQNWVEGGYQAIVVKARDASQTEGIRRALDAQGYGTLTVQDIVQVIGSVFDVLKAVLGAVASIGLFVAFFGIANTMLMAILERTREIGVMKALGARNAHVRRLFVVEAAAIGVLGGTAGVVTGWGLGAAFNRIARGIVAGQGGPENISLFSVTPALALAAAGFAVLVAIAAGLYPAWRAARLHPVDALRSL